VRGSSRLSEIDRVYCIRGYFTSLEDLCFKQFKCDAMYALYDILGLKIDELGMNMRMKHD